MKALLIPALVLSALPVFAEEDARQPIEEGAGVVATVNGKPIFFEDLERRLGNMHMGRQTTERGAFDVDQLMFRVVNDSLLAEEARVLGMHEEEPIPERLAKLRRKLATERLEREEIWQHTQPSEEEVRETFATNYQTATLRVLTSYEREEAEQLAAELESGADFEELVREHSIDQYSARGGLLSDLDRVDIPVEIAEVAFASEPGTLAGPIRTGLGWANIRVESVEPADFERFPVLEQHVTNIVRQRRARDRRRELGTRLREIHPTTVEWEAVNAITVDQLADGRLMAEVPDPEAIVARVGEREVRAEPLGRALQLRWKGVRNREAAEAARALVVERMIQEELLIVEAERRGYDSTPGVLRQAHAFETQLLVPRYLKEVVGTGVEASAEEIRAYYDENRERYRKPPRIHYRQMTVASSDEAERLAGLLREGTDFGWLARQHSIDRFKENGGDRGWTVPAPSLDDFQRALYEGKPGDVLGPQGAEGNFRLFRIDAREEQGLYTFEEVAGRARSAAYSMKFAAALDQHITKLRERSEITIHEDVLSAMSITGQPLEKEEGAAAHGH